MAKRKREPGDIWYDDFGDAWESQMKYDGYVVYPDDFSLPQNELRLLRIAEGKWRPATKGYNVPSPLWDAATPSTMC